MKATNIDDTPLPVKLLTAGTAACIADFATFPLDTAKVRLQVQGEGHAIMAMVNHYHGLVGTMTTIAKEEGAKSLYNGLSAGLQRQMCFASVRLGLYDTVKAYYQGLIDGPTPKEGMQVGTRIAAGLTTGGLAVLIAQPTDVVKVRFQAQQKGSLARYTSTMQAYKVIAKDEGAKGLWRGTFPNVGRNAIVNVSEIVCYDIIKETILKSKLMDDNVPCHFTSAVIAGFCTTVVASPIDVIKTRYMNSPVGEYKGAIDCGIRTIIKEGPIALYKGFTPSFCRLVSWNIVMWLTYEQMKKQVYNLRHKAD